MDLSPPVNRSERAATGSGDQSQAASQSAFINISLANQINPAVMWINGAVCTKPQTDWASGKRRHCSAEY